MGFARWGVIAAVLLTVGAVIGAAIDSEPPASSGGAAQGSSAAEPTATPTPAPARQGKLSTKPKKTKPKPQATATPTATAAPPAFVACDPNIRAKSSTTTCAFAQNVFYEYWYVWNYYELAAFAAYSAAGDAWFDMRCTGSSTITCSAGDGAEVRFPMRAVVAYTESNADRYAAGHTVSATTDDFYASGPPDDAEPEYSAPESGYGDVDCSEIPDTDFATPPGDPDGLDADGDGVACES